MKLRHVTVACAVYLVAGLNLAAEEAARERCAYAFFAQDASSKTIQYGRARPIDVTHIKIDVDLDFEREQIAATTTTSMIPIGEALSEVNFDAVDLDVVEVRLADGTICDFESTLDHLNVFLPNTIEAGTEFSLAVTYTAKPDKGLYFRTERMGYKKSEVMVWSQGEPDEARHWFPSFDYPNEKSSTEVIATVPAEYLALSNGELLDTTHNTARGTKTYRWLQSYPHTNYLIALVAGDLVTVDDTRYDVPIFYYVQRGKEEDARLSLAKTPDIIKFFGDKIGVPYPYTKYGQVSIVDFTFGGMENTSLTTLTERTFHDADAHLTYSSDSLNAHEAAHQWWGDMLTCRDWSHIWLNEGFATYFDALFKEFDRGHDDFLYEMRRTRKIYQATDSGDRRAPIVRRHYENIMELFDDRVYEKGGWVLHMLRRKLGDDLWWKAMHEYATRFAGKVVETNQLMRTIEEVTGHGLERFFEQWVYSGGYPKINVAYSWSNAEKLAKVTVKQTQEVDDITPLFHFDVDLRFVTKDGDHVESITISKAEETFHFPLSAKPVFVRFDPDGDVLIEVNFKKPVDMLVAQLKDDTSILGRIAAAEGLEEKDTDRALEALEQALNDDPFWGVRVEVAEVLGGFEHDRAIDVLSKALKQDDARVRNAAANALGKTDEDAGPVLIAAVSDRSPYVAAAAIRALARIEHSDAVPTIVRALNRDSHSQVIRSAALRALADLEAERSLNTVISYTRASKPRMSRRSAISATGEIGSRMEKTDRPRNALLDLLDDPSRFVRRAALSALGTLGDQAAIPPIRRFADASNSDSDATYARRIIGDIRKEKAQTEEVKDLRETVSDLEETQESLENKIEELVSRVDAISKSNEESDENDENEESP